MGARLSAFMLRSLQLLMLSTALSVSQKTVSGLFDVLVKTLLAAALFYLLVNWHSLEGDYTDNDVLSRNRNPVSCACWLFSSLLGWCLKISSLLARIWPPHLDPIFSRHS